jgi:hypothetical protein
MPICQRRWLEPHHAAFGKARERRLPLRRQILRSGSSLGGQADPGETHEAAVVELQEVAGRHPRDGRRHLLALGGSGTQQHDKKHAKPTQWWNSSPTVRFF